jgi:hypothetical protein
LLASHHPTFTGENKLKGGKKSKDQDKQPKSQVKGIPEKMNKKKIEDEIIYKTNSRKMAKPDGHWFPC